MDPALPRTASLLIAASDRRVLAREPGAAGDLGYRQVVLQRSPEPPTSRSPHHAAPPAVGGAYSPARGSHPPLGSVPRASPSLSPSRSPVSPSRGGSIGGSPSRWSKPGRSPGGDPGSAQRAAAQYPPPATHPASVRTGSCVAATASSPLRDARAAVGGAAPPPPLGYSPPPPGYSPPPPAAGGAPPIGSVGHAQAVAAAHCAAARAMTEQLRDLERGMQDAQERARRRDDGWVQRITRFLEHYDPPCASMAEPLLFGEKFRGRPDDLLRELEALYGPESAVPASPGALAAGGSPVRPVSGSPTASDPAAASPPPPLPPPRPLPPAPERPSAADVLRERMRQRSFRMMRSHWLTVRPSQHAGFQLQSLLDDRSGELAGVEVTRVDPHSPAGLSGIKAGDIIVEMDGRGVRSLTDAESARRDFYERARWTCGASDGARLCVRVETYDVEAADRSDAQQAVAGAESQMELQRLKQEPYAMRDPGWEWKDSTLGDAERRHIRRTLAGVGTRPMGSWPLHLRNKDDEGKVNDWKITDDARWGQVQPDWKLPDQAPAVEKRREEAPPPDKAEKKEEKADKKEKKDDKKDKKDKKEDKKEDKKDKKEKKDDKKEKKEDKKEKKGKKDK